MKRVTLFLLLTTGLLLWGCGEKIAIPEPEGLFSVSGYKEAGIYDNVSDPRQLIEKDGALFLIHGTSLSKRDQSLQIIDTVEPVTGLGDPTALCALPDTGLVFVYDQATTTVSWYAGADLSWMGSAVLPEVLSTVAMGSQSNGIDLVQDGYTFLYLSDPTAGVIHRYAFTYNNELVPFGILTMGGGESARYVHQVAGMAQDDEGMLLVCDSAPERNWVIRFDSTPDLLDVTEDEDDVDPMRGLAVTFNDLDCVPQPTAAYVLGSAPGCNETSWEGAPSSADGEFHSPQAVAVDGIGRIFVCDTENNRIQIFSNLTTGIGYDFGFVIDADTPRRPMDISLIEFHAAGKIFNAAYVFVTVPDDDLIYKFMSADVYQHLNPGIPFTP